MVKQKAIKDDMLIIRIDKQAKEKFTFINKKKKIKNSQRVREWIEEYIKENR